MSTSPSWFDQEKFSRLVKKVGPKPVFETAPGQPGTEPENRLAPAEPVAPTSRISLASRPPSLLPERRALPALPRRTSRLPSLKGLFSTTSRPAPAPIAESAPAAESTSSATPPVPEASAETYPVTEEVKEDKGAPETNGGRVSLEKEAEELTAVWQKMSLLNEELAHAIQQRDQAIHEGIILREQLRQADDALESDRGNSAPSAEDLSRLVKERDTAFSEREALRDQLRREQQATRKPGGPGTEHELSVLTEERDRARRDYATIRKHYEALKLEQAPREENGQPRRELEQQLEGLRRDLEQKNREIASLKVRSGGGISEEKLKQEVLSLREQLSRAKDEASIAQRGLALSQKALHETRDTLREATEGTSLSRHNFDNLKNECAILAQQNSVLQAQNDQLSRELGAAKSKLTTRL